MSLRDFTLLLPTYNRPDDLRRNIQFHDAQGLTSRILVLDSSRPDVKEANRIAIKECQLDVDLITYDPAIHPFEKFADGIARVETPYSGLCADDDLLLLAGLRASLDALAKDCTVAVAHGYYFLFGHLQDKTNMDLTTMLYASPGIVEEHPFERLKTLMRSYQALTYGIYRSDVLKDIYRNITGVKSLMFRELLSSALPVLAGKAIRVPQFYGARAHATGDDEQRKRWHPTEWFMRDGADLIGEYVVYRKVLANFYQARFGGEAFDTDRVTRLIDLVHYGYLSRHLPSGVQEYVFAEELKGRSIDDYWQDQHLQRSLLDAHNSEFAAASPFPVTRRVAEFFPQGAINTLTGAVIGWPAVVRTSVRDYRFYQGFLDNNLSSILDIDAPMVKELVNCLDLYPTE